MSAGPYRNDLHRLMSQPESWFISHTPNWPKDDDEPKTSVTITVNIRCDGRGLSREQAAKFCKRIERISKNKTRTISAII